VVRKSNHDTYHCFGTKKRKHDTDGMGLDSSKLEIAAATAMIDSTARLLIADDNNQQGKEIHHLLRSRADKETVTNND
jgi:hypothetical protein